MGCLVIIIGLLGGMLAARFPWVAFGVLIFVAVMLAIAALADMARG